jgi:hypothetical protein
MIFIARFYIFSAARRLITVERTSQLRHGRCESWAFWWARFFALSQATMLAWSEDFVSQSVFHLTEGKTCRSVF